MLLNMMVVGSGKWGYEVDDQGLFGNYSEVMSAAWVTLVEILHHSFLTYRLPIFSRYTLKESCLEIDMVYGS